MACLCGSRRGSSAFRWVKWRAGGVCLPLVRERKPATSGQEARRGSVSEDSGLGDRRDPQFLHKIVDGICGRAYPRYQDYGSIWSLSEWMDVLEETVMYFKTAVGQNISDEEAAQQINELNSNYQEAIAKCLKGRKEEIRNALVERVNAISSAQLQDFDWQLKLALSSDKISMLQMPLLNLDLDVREDGEIKPISIEMNKEELQNLINALEAANKVVLQLK